MRFTTRGPRFRAARPDLDPAALAEQTMLERLRKQAAARLRKRRRQKSLQ